MVEDPTQLVSDGEPPRDEFSLLFRTSADAMAITRVQDGVYLDVNPAFETLSGHSRAEVLGESALDLDWVERSDRDDMVAELRATGALGPREARFKDSDGQVRHGSYTCVIIEHGGQPAILTIMRDITALKEAQVAADDQRARWATLIDNFPGVAWSTDTEMCYTSITGGLLVGRGNSEDAFVGMRVDEPLQTEPEKEIALGNHRRALAGEKLNYDTDFSGIPFANFLAPLRDTEGNITGAVGFAVDITARRQAEISVLEREARLQMLADNMPGIIFTTDPDLIITSVEGAGLKRMGISASALAGGDAASTFAPEDPELDERMREVLQGGFLHSDASMGGRVFEMLVQPMTIDGEVRGLIGATIDVTENRDVQEATQRYADRLKSLYEMEQDILASRSVREIATRTVERLQRMVGCERVSLVEFDPALEVATLQAVATTGETDLAPGHTSTPEELFGDLSDLRAGIPRDSGDLAEATDSHHSLEMLKQMGFRSVLSIPMLTGGELLGVLNMASMSRGGIGDEESETAREAATQLAVAIQQSRLRSKVSEYARELELRLEDLKRTDAERRRLLSQLVEAQEEERRTIAADIHDDTLQKMAAVGLRLDVLRRRLEDPSLSEEAGKLAKIVNLTIDGMRHLMFDLWPGTLEQHGLAEAVRVDLVSMKETGHLEATLDDRSTTALSMELRTIAYRIVQEALANVTKHSGASKVAVFLEDIEGGLRVRVRDDGLGIPEDIQGSPPGHLGLSAMRERAALAGGWLKASPAAGGGTQIEFFIPVG